MVTHKSKKSSDFIMPLFMNGLHGRMLRMPPPKGKKSELLLVYGHHASLERTLGLAEAFNDHIGVTMPDLPGFGGMQSFYKIGEKPTIDNLADYLASFVKLRYRHRRFSIGGLSFGFIIVTRMLQKYPEITERVDLIISMVGFSHYEDFTFSKPRRLMYRYGSGFFARRWPAVFFRNIALHPLAIKTFYSRTYNAKHKFAQVKSDQLDRVMKFEIHLWRINDVRSHMETTRQMLTVDNCQQRINKSLWHLSVRHDNYFDNGLVEQHLRVIYNDFQTLQIKTDAHSISRISDKKAAAILVPSKLKELLNKQT